MDTDAFEALGTMLWSRPTWVPASSEADFEFSWDFVEHFFTREGADLDDRRPLIGLIAELRAVGYGPRLRAGQSLNRLVLSRSREHGLRDEQSFLCLDARADGFLAVSGTIADRARARDRIEATITEWLATRLEELAAVPID